MKKIARGAVGVLAAGAAAAAAGWCLLLRPRRNQPGWEKFEGVRYAHGVSTMQKLGFRRTLWPPSGGQWSRALARSWTST